MLEGTHEMEVPTMPWQETKPMDQKILFIADYLRDTYSHTELCARYGISRKTGYKWLERYQRFELDGLTEHSRRPRQSPQSTPYAIRKAIIELRTTHRITPGAKKIRALLAQRFSNETIPSKTTIYNILNAEGLVQKKPKHRGKVPPYPQPFAPANDANEVWSADYKGQFKLGNGQWCYPLTVMDHHSRYLLCCQGIVSTAGELARKQFTRLFREYGLPRRIRTDNGTPFASRATGGLSSLSIWWIRLGIVPERIKPGKPQQNGRHERMHRTLKRATTRPVPAKSFAAQQRRFDAFQHEYNQQRPHEALGQTPPAQHYRASAREYPTRLPEITYPDHFEVKPVCSSGVIYVHNGQVYVSHLLVGENVGMEEVDDGIWDIYFGPMRLGGFDRRKPQGGKHPYWTVKV
jgi:putative transposase